MHSSINIIFRYMKVQTKKLFIEGVLIVFSVLFALFLSQVAENQKTRKEKEKALEYIHQELSDNKDILTGWIYYHGKTRERLRKMVSDPNDSVRSELKASGRIDFEIITDGNNLIDVLLTKTAWEAAKSTNIASEIEFEQVQQLTRIYSLQDILMENITGKFLDIYMDRDTHKIENLETTLIQLNLIINEMVGQEETLHTMISEFQKKYK